MVFGELTPGPSWWSLLAALTLPGVTTRIYASDEIQYFAFLRSLWFDRDVSFDNEYRHFVANGVDARPDVRRDVPGAGHRNRAAPELRHDWVGAAVGAVLRGCRRRRPRRPRDGLDRRRRRLLGAVHRGGLFRVGRLRPAGPAAVVVRRAARPRGGGLPAGPHAAAASAAVGLGTPLLFYMYVAPGFAHATSAFAVAAFVWPGWWSASAGRLPAWSSLGALAALMTMVREQDAFFVVGPAVDFAWSVCANGGCAAAGAALAGAAAAFAGVPAAGRGVSRAQRPARPVASRQPQDDWASPHALDVLVSPEHGLFFWTPLAVLAIAGLVAADRAPGAPRAVGRRRAHPRGVAPDWRRPAGRSCSSRSTSPAPSRAGRWPARSASVGSWR